jgi:hypothetical protein
MRGFNMLAVRAFSNALIQDFVHDPTYCQTYYGSWISNVVYKWSYPELGQVWNDLTPLFEEMSFHFNDKYDGQNVIEEMTCDILIQLFNAFSVITNLDDNPQINIRALEDIVLRLESSVVG